MGGFSESLCDMFRYKQRQVRKKEERARAFEAVFSDPEMDLEEVAAQVRSKSLSVRCVLRAGLCWVRLE